MTLPSSGAISIGNIRDEFGGTGARAISTYYRGGSLVPNHESNDDIPTSGLIRLSDFRDTAKNFIATMISGLGASTVGYIEGTHGSMSFTFVGRSGSSARAKITLLHDTYIKGFYTNTVFQLDGDQTGTWWSSITITSPSLGTNTFFRGDTGIYNSNLDVTTWPVGGGPYFSGTETHSIVINIP